MQKAHYAKSELQKRGLLSPFAGPFFNEFVIRLNQPVDDVNARLRQKGIIGGYNLGFDYPELANHMLVAVTELRTKEEIDRFVNELGDGHA